MSICDDVQRRLAEDGVGVVREDAELQRHLDGCAACRELLQALRRLDETLRDLPEHDVPKEVVEASLRAVQQAAEHDPRPWSFGSRRQRLAGAMAASVVIVATFGVTYDVWQRGGYDFGTDFVAAEKPHVPADLAENAPASAVRVEKAGPAKDRSSRSGRVETTSEQRAIDRTIRGNLADALSHSNARAPANKNQAKFETPKALTQGQSTLRRSEAETGEARLGKEAELIARLQMPSAGKERRFNFADRGRDKKTSDRQEAEPQTKPVPSRPYVGGKYKTDSERKVVSGGAVTGPAELDRRSDDTSTDADSNSALSIRIVGALDNRESRRHRGDAFAEDEEKNEQAQSLEGEENNRLRAEEEDDERKGLAGAGGRAKANEEVAAALRPAQSEYFAYREQTQSRGPGISGPGDDRDGEQVRRLAQVYLAQANALDGLSYQSAAGYWANTYIPGDPDMRLLQARLVAWDRRKLSFGNRLEQTVQPVAQRLDTSNSAALGLFLHSDARAVSGPTRLRLQVGLKGANRQGGHRPAMNVGLVIDLRGGGDGTLGRRISALVTALERARQLGDRFSLIVAGPSGGLVVAPEAFRHGPLKVALGRLFGEQRQSGESNFVDLQDAISLARDSVTEVEGADSVQGASLILVATGASLDVEHGALESLAHRNAVGGVSMSVVSLGREVDPDHIDRLVAAGQGRRRVLPSADQADIVIDRELHSASRAVARAVRLRIRLAPGVNLVDVLGSRRLDPPQAERVREAERTIDRRLAHELGITSDRGRDEEGIQIVIPNFYAGDSHVVLLDVVADRPGPIAEVTARYKDLIHLKNGIAQAQLTIGSGENARGPLERNVLKNYLAWDLAREMRQFVRLFEAGRIEEAKQQMAGFKRLIQGLRLEVPGWSTDPDLAADESLLARYLQAFGSPLVADPIQRQLLADSLRYAAFAKLHSGER